MEFFINKLSFLRFPFLGSPFRARRRRPTALHQHSILIALVRPGRCELARCRRRAGSLIQLLHEFRLDAGSFLVPPRPIGFTLLLQFFDLFVRDFALDHFVCALEY